jgi:hypothetical protein
MPATKSAPSKPATRKRASPAKKPAATKPAAKKPTAAIASARKTVTAGKMPIEKKSDTLPVVLTKPNKVKLVRDSFTLPEADHELIKKCKKSAITSGRETKKSEVVRAAIQSFSQLSLDDQLKIYNALQPIAVGRPKSD